MRTVGIVGENVEKLVRTFNRLSYGDINLTDGGLQAAPFNVLIAQDAKPALNSAIAALKDGAFLILNSDKKEILPFLAKRQKAFRLITYGFNSKACVTASSTLDGVMQACVQRGFTTLNARRRQPGEYGFPFAGALAEIEADAVLGFAAACLVCGAI